MQALPILKPGDSVSLIAPASRCTDERIAGVKALLSTWQLNSIVPDDLFGNDVFCANSDELRFKNLKEALENSQTKAVICLRGGYGSMRLIPELSKLKPVMAKLFIGMSDVTALHLYLQNQWQWPTIHGAMAVDKFSAESHEALKSLLFAEQPIVEFAGLIPLNAKARQPHSVQASITGGNLTLVQAGIGTAWQMNARDKIILLEEIGERGYRVDRMLEHLKQANLFKGATAILFGDFIEGNEPNGTSLLEHALERFAVSCDIPVLRIKGVGHDYTNFPIPLGMPATLLNGKLTIPSRSVSK